MQVGACYIRVSTDEQTEYSPDAQLRAIKDYAKRNDILIADEYIYKDEGISGKRADKRPAFQKMITTAKSKPAPFEVILVHRFDRFARSREDSIVYKSLLRKDCNIRVISTTEPLEDDKMSMLMEAMLEAMAEYYSLNLADEVKKGMFEKARRGENIGKAAYGYKLENSLLIPDDAEREIVKLIFNSYLDGSISSVTRYLNLSNIPTRTGGNWTQTTIRYMLENPIYIGTIRYNYRKGGRRNSQNEPFEWILAQGRHEPIITKEVFEAVQDKLSRMNKFFERNYSEKNIRHWAQHLVRCEDCGRVMSITSCDHGKYTAYRCSSAAAGICRGKALSTKKMEALLIDQIHEDFNNPNNIEIEQTYNNESSLELEALNAQLKKLDTKFDLIKRSYLAQVDTLEEYKANKEQLQNKESEILHAIEKIIKAQKESNKKTGSLIQFENFITLLGDSDVSTEEKNRIAKQFIKEVRLNLADKSIRVIYFFY